MQTEQIEGFRLSPQQQHLWRMQQTGAAGAYRVQGAILVEGAVDPGVLEDSIAFVVAQHEILRTTYQCPSGMSVPVQVIASGGVAAIHKYDLSDLDVESQKLKLEDLFRELKTVSFDLERGPLLHGWLVTLSPVRSEFLIAMPALTGDAMGFSNLVNEFCAACAARLAGHEPPPTAAPQYADLAEWQTDLLTSDDAHAGIEFWRTKPVAAAVAARVPHERQPDAPVVFTPTFVSVDIEPEITAKINELVSKFNVSTAAFFVSCWQTLLWRLNGIADQTIAVGCDGRTYEELQPALGLLSRYLPIHAACDGDVKFSDLLHQINTSLANGFDRQEYFSWDHLDTSTAVDHHGRFLPFALDFDRIPPPSSVTEGVTLSVRTIYHCIERFKLKLSVEERGGCLRAMLHFDSTIFNSADVERTIGQLQTLLSSILAQPDATLDELNILTDAERRQLLVHFNDTQVEDPGGNQVIELVQEQAARTPERLAVVFDDLRWTYGQLNGRANQLARHLQTLGVGPGVMVGLYMEQSADVIVGLLGILKAGGAYVPLDADYPKERIELVLKDTHAPVLLTQARLQGEAPAHEGRTVCIDSDWGVIARESDANPVSPATGADLAYVIYTSGSTGRPKGVPITHRNLAHSTFARTLYYRQPVGRYLLLSSFAFDSSVAGIFWTLSQGGTLVLPAAGLQRDPAQVNGLIGRHQVTHLLCLPSLYALMLAETTTQSLGSLRTVIVAGEACPIELVRTHQLELQHAALFNEYGPTEGTVWSTVYDCQLHAAGLNVPIGRPIPNVQVYILNSRLQPVPIGVAGELYVGGSGVANGYLNRPDITAEKFIANPFAEWLARNGKQSGARLYRTGDLGRYLPDGNIEFLGRVDQQVKIRGYRIELGEIEAALRQHAAVREVVVAAREDTPGDKRLVAYVVAASGRPASVDELRQFLARRLPEFMLPSAFVFLDALPLNANGKVDRQALPEPGRARPELAKSYAPPRNAVEQVLAGMWGEVLSLDRVGIHDDFFDLGGHSILVTRFVAHLRETFHIEVPLRAIFESPTVAGLSDTLRQDASQWSKVARAAELVLQLDSLSGDEVEAMLKEQHVND